MAIMNVDPETNVENQKQIDCLKLEIYLNINSVSIAWAFIVQTVYKQVSYQNNKSKLMWSFFISVYGHSQSLE